MKFFNSIPRGLVIFLGGIVLVIVLILGYRALFVPSSSGASPVTHLFSALFPFGNSSASPSGNSSGNATPLTTPEKTGAVPILRQVSDAPVSGDWFAKNPTATTTPLILFMQRESGHISETPADSFAEARISNTTIPGIEELYAVSDSTLIVRSLDDTGAVQNFFGILNATSSEQSFTPTPIRAFASVSVDRASGTMLTVTKQTGGSRVELSNGDGSKLQTLLTSPISSWVPLLAGGRTFLETAPTAAAAGYLYELKGAGSQLTKIVGGAGGFTASVSPSGRYIAYSGNTAAGFFFSVIDTKTNTETPSPIHALTLKCAWIPNGEPLLLCAVPKNPPQASYPDDWLLGNASFSDDAWIIDSVKNTAHYIGALTDQNGAGIDAENISVDTTGSYALFMNKKDLSLWSLNIQNTVRAALHI